MADPASGPIVGHNDVCFENVVFRDDAAVGLLDFDFAAPGRLEYDLGQFAPMCVPVDDEVSAARLGWGRVEGPARLRLVADAYGLDAAGRRELLELLGGSSTSASSSADSKNAVKGREVTVDSPTPPLAPVVAPRGRRTAPQVRGRYGHEAWRTAASQCARRWGTSSLPRSSTKKSFPLFISTGGRAPGIVSASH